MVRIIAFAAAFAVVILTGVAHGLWTNRWRPSEELVRAAERVPAIPPKIGDWEGIDKQMDEAQRVQAEIEGYVMRTYKNPTRSALDEVQLLVVCGKPGPISNHTPDICYGGIGYKQVGSLQSYPVTPADGGAPAEFKEGLFVSHATGIPAYLRVMWSFSADGNWSAPDRTRWVFGHSPFLYKIYVVREVQRPDEQPLAKDAAVEFLQQLLPPVRQALFPPPPET